MLGSRNHPILCIHHDIGDDERHQGVLITKEPHIPFIPDRPGSEHGKREHIAFHCKPGVVA